VIDDLGKEKPTLWVEQMVYEIINGRYEDNKPVIITTNTSLVGIQDQYDKNGPAIVSRIVEMCQGVKMDGADWRKGRLK
jgi:DNA replication protein DnaC